MGAVFPFGLGTTAHSAPISKKHRNSLRFAFSFRLASLTSKRLIRKIKKSIKVDKINPVGLFFDRHSDILPLQRAQNKIRSLQVLLTFFFSIVSPFLR